MEKLQQLASWLQLTSLDTCPQLTALTEKTTLKPSILAIITSTVLILLSIVLNISPLITTIACVLIPGYMTFAVIGTKLESEYIKFLVYWVSFGVFEVVVRPLLGLLFGDFFLMILQLVVVIALLHPKFNFALILYDRVIRVYVLKTEARTDTTNEQAPQQTVSPRTKAE